MRRRLALIGMGKMGTLLAQLAPEREWDVVATFDSSGNDRGKAITVDSLAGADVAIEFTQPDAAPDNVRACLAAGCPVVVGTTGWEGERAKIEAEVRAMQGAMLTAANFSLGVNLFARIVREAARQIASAPGFDAHLVETHHSAKKDAPSGTAKMLQREVEEALDRPLPITSVRIGSVPGTHALLFDGAFEQIQLIHEARDRRAFADGALVAARWLVGRRGVFTMADVLSGASEVR